LKDIMQQSDIELRPPELVMRLARLGAMHQTRLSFLRAMLRRAYQDRWMVSRPVWNLDSEGIGHAVYAVATPEHRYSLVAFSQKLAPELRTDRVIAEAWDTAYALYDGVPDSGEIERLGQNVPKQEAGRYTERELILSRANKSVRLFEGVVKALAAGHQPDSEEIESVGYLMRTTAVYGNGKFGIADRDCIANRPELAGPFRAEMLTVWLIRAFTVDLVEHCARAMSPGTAVLLHRDIRRRLGVGNATGLGLAPFLVKHPILLHRWITAREKALARVRALRTTELTWRTFIRSLEHARRSVKHWHTDDTLQACRIETLQADLHALWAWAHRMPVCPESWDAVYCWSEDNLSLEGQEYTVSLLIEQHGSVVDDLCDAMSADEGECTRIDGTISARQLADLIDQHYSWAFNFDFSKLESRARFWYVSEEKLEPRLGDRYTEPGAHLEQPLAFARDVVELRGAINAVPADEKIASVLLNHPEYRHVVRRVQLVACYPYAEIRDNLIGADLRPIDLLRCKLAFFGACRFDPRSDRWLRICLFQGAPFPGEILEGKGDDWAETAA
jgi:hypothetical protein